MNYFKYIFSDKKALKYWLILYVLVIIPFLVELVIGYLNNQLNEINLFEILYFSFLSFGFFIFYTAGYLNVKRRHKFLAKYKGLIEKSSIQKSEVEVFRSSYIVNGFRTNFTAIIKPKSKFDIFTTCKIENKIVLFGQTYDFGIFRRDIPPIIIDIYDYENTKKYKYARSRKMSIINWIEKDMEIIFKRNVFGIKKIRLLDWEK